MISKLIDFQKQQRQHVIEKLNAARTTIEQELEELGYYPNNDGRLNAKELCRRAGIGASTLKNKTHKSTRASVQRWLKRLKATRSVAQPRSRGTDATQLERSLTSLSQELDVFKLQYEKLEIHCTTVETENDKLRTENAILRTEKMRVVNITPV